MKFTEVMHQLNEKQNDVRFSFTKGRIEIYKDENSGSIARLFSDKFTATSTEPVKIIQDGLNIKNEDITYWSSDTDTNQEAKLTISVKGRTVRYFVTFEVDENPITHRYSFDIVLTNFKG